MAAPLRKGTHINVERKMFGVNYSMPAMEMAKDYYELGFILSGDRKAITPTETYYSHAGDVGTTLPYLYHRTISASDVPYERVLIKFTPDYIEPFIEEFGQQEFDRLYQQKICRFLEPTKAKIRDMFLEMAEEFEKNDSHREFILQGMLFRLLYTICQEKLPDSEIEKNFSPLTPPIMDAMVYMEDNYAKNPSLEEIAGVVGFSTAYFSRLFSSQVGMSYSEYLERIKIRHVQVLLTQSKKSIMEIAEEVGYCHGNYLNSQFKKKIGMTPGEYRRKSKAQKEV